jgi:hypothetical protein
MMSNQVQASLNVSVNNVEYQTGKNSATYVFPRSLRALAAAHKFFKFGKYIRRMLQP